MIQVIEHNRHRSLEVISSEVLKALHAWFGDREQHEDTLMLARRTVAAS